MLWISFVSVVVVHFVLKTCSRVGGVSAGEISRLGLKVTDRFLPSVICSGVSSGSEGQI